MYAPDYVAVSIGSDRDSTGTAVGRELVDMRKGSGRPAGTYCYEGSQVATGWHAHDLHQLELAVRGMVEVEDASGHYLLPPQQAAWIPAGVRHETTIHTDVRTISVFFEPVLIAEPGERVRVVAVAPLLREMIVHAVRWPISRRELDMRADAFFAALADVVAETLEHEAPLRLPTSTDPLVAASMAVTRERLRGVTVEEVARSIGTSPRTLRRRFESAVGVPWRTYLIHARLLRAMTLLADPTPTILAVALAVGFDSQTGFTRAFVAHCGETPSAYRRRVLVR